MIGVVAKPGQAAVIEEFFELFKTPWEFYEQGRSYDVLVMTTGDVPVVHGAKAVVIFGSEPQTADAQYGISHLAKRHGAWVNAGSALLPIYSDFLTFEEHNTATTCLSSDAGIGGLRIESRGTNVFRLGYDLFDEVFELLANGQPVAQANVPTLDLHIDFLREWILSSGVELIEIPPIPAGHPFVVCLTHDIDFIGIRQHVFDHSMWGFLYRSTVGGALSFARGTVSARRLLRMWQAVATVPFVFLGWARDFWEPFEWYLRVEQGLPATYFLIPFKGRPGDRVSSRVAHRRATAYDISDVEDRAVSLTKEGCEVGVHGIDAWHSSDRGRSELARIAGATGTSRIGIRMHWLLHDRDTASMLDDAGYAYDSTNGYNETVGYRNGTTQVFRPLAARALLELPMHIQDGALFYRERLNLSENEAWMRCTELITRTRQIGGVLTVLWHDRSHGPERFWGDFYIRLVQNLRSSGAWFATALQAVHWFETRRRVTFERIGPTVAIRLGGEANEIHPPLRIRTHRKSVSQSFVDVRWSGMAPICLDASLQRQAVPAIGAGLPSFGQQTGFRS